MISGSVVPANDADMLSPGDFLRTQRVSLLIAGAAVGAIMLTAVFSVDPAYNYPRLITDQLLYYMKGLSFVRDGTTAARAAINVPPFTYAATPGLLRTPFIAAFGDFDDQLRAIQVSNIALGVILGGLSAYVLSWALPRRLHDLAVAFSFTTLLLNPVWVTNMLSPLADLPYAVASLGAVVVVNRMIRGTESEKRSPFLKLLFVLLFIVAFGCRYTAPVILLYGWLVFRQQKNKHDAVGTALRRVGVAAIIALAALIIADFHTIVFGYLWQPYQLLIHSDIRTLALNTFALGIPSQVIPGLDLLYRAPILNIDKPVFWSNPVDLGLTALGVAISAVTAIGAWRGRSQFAAEAWYVLAPLPVLAAMIPSTARYLLSYQPFVWLFLYIGVSGFAAHLAPRFRWRRAMTLALVALCCVGAMTVLYIRSGRVTGSQRVTLASFSLGRGRRHAPEVARTYRALREFLESLPAGDALMLGERGSSGQWKVIAGIDYYDPDTALATIARRRAIYVVANCQSKVFCSGFREAIKDREAQIRTYGAFEFDSVFAARNNYSAAAVYRLRVAN